MLTASNPVYAGQVFTGKIVIDGVVVGGNSDDIVHGSGVLAKEVRQVGAFQGVINKTAADVNYAQNSTVQVVVSGDNNILPLITTSVSAGQLTINSTKNYQAKLPLVVEINSPQLDAFVLDGSGDAKLKGINEKNLMLTSNGSGDIAVEGKTGNLSIAVNGASDINAKNLVAHTAKVNLTGSGDVKVTAKQSLKAVITGSGDINYYGAPTQVEKEISGSGDIEPGD